MRSIPIFYSSELSSKLLWGGFCCCCFVFRTAKLLDFALKIEPRETEFVSFFLWEMLQIIVFHVEVQLLPQQPKAERPQALGCALRTVVSPPWQALFSASLEVSQLPERVQRSRLSKRGWTPLPGGATCFGTSPVRRLYCPSSPGPTRTTGQDSA